MASGSSSFFKRCLCSGSASEMHTRTASLTTLTRFLWRISESPKARHEVGFKANQLGVSISATASNKDSIFIAKLNAHSPPDLKSLDDLGHYRALAITGLTL